MQKLQVILCAFVLCFALSQTVRAQAVQEKQEEVLSNTQGFFLQGHFQGHGLTVEEDDADSGRGFGIKAGYGFSSLFTLYLGIDGASMDVADPGNRPVVGNEYTLAYVDLGGRFNFRAGPNSLVPYLDGSLTGIGSVYSTGAGDATFSGSAFSIGGGVQYFISPQFAFNGGLHLSFGGYSELEISGQTESVDLSVTGARIDIGFSWYPF
jgi:hypothetical protein